MKYTTVLMDADETILDFFRTEENALRRSFAHFGFPFGKDTHPIYHEINQKLWHEFSMGRLDKPTLTVRRFSELFSVLGLDADPVAFKECYEGWIGQGYYTIPGAEELLQTLRSMGCALYCTTNGLKRTQYSRLSGAGLLQYFEKLFISEEAGSQKPQRAYFDYVFASVPEKNPEKFLLVGDSLTTDIAGGNNAGIDTVWYNPSGEIRGEGDAQPTYEVKTLAEIPGIVSGE